MTEYHLVDILENIICSQDFVFARYSLHYDWEAGGNWDQDSHKRN